MMEAQEEEGGGSAVPLPPRPNHPPPAPNEHQPTSPNSHPNPQSPARKKQAEEEDSDEQFPLLVLTKSERSYTVKVFYAFIVSIVLYLYPP